MKIKIAENGTVNITFTAENHQDSRSLKSVVKKLVKNYREQKKCFISNK